MTVETRMGKITACREVLNLISIAYYESADRRMERGQPNIAQCEIEIANEIHIALEKSGYYEN